VTIAIRAAGAADIDTIVAFNVAMAAESEGRDLHPERLRSGLEWIIGHPAEGRVIVAERNGERAGSAMMTYEWSEWRNGRFWWIQSVYVEPSHRRHGVYRAIHAWIRAQAAADPQACGIRLYVEKDNGGARAAYLGLGMVVTDYDLMEEDFTLTGR
jgi:GNAT superfamily N-acetyltransferase